MEIGTALLVVPPALQIEVEAAAAEEHRSAEDVLRDAVERYLRSKRWQKLFAYGEQRARETGITEEDVPRLISEYRQESRRDQ